MKLYVGVTDNDWFRFLAERQPDEVNFWRPGGGSFRAIEKWEPFLFKLHSPLNYIVGGGFFVKCASLPLSFAWEVFEEKNGAPHFPTFYEKIRHYRERRGTMELDPDIGCIVLTEPFFFDRDDWIPSAEYWRSGIRQGKTYDTRESLGARLWDRVQALLERYPVQRAEEAQESAVVERPRYGDEYLIRPRLGQGGFRVAVTEAYGRRGAITGERILPVLQAAHIKPYAESGPHDVQNGLLLRADLHILFDRGYVTVTRDHHVEASRRLREDFDNGEEYYRMHGGRLATVPSGEDEMPAAEFIDWHNEHVFRP
jgi:putative restriction endonuclease